jgi:hypothetical protein
MARTEEEHMEYLLKNAGEESSTQAKEKQTLFSPFICPREGRAIT